MLTSHRWFVALTFVDVLFLADVDVSSFGVVDYDTIPGLSSFAPRAVPPGRRRWWNPFEVFAALGCHTC
jgi:hypothetical protein